MGDLPTHDDPVFAKIQANKATASTHYALYALGRGHEILGLRYPPMPGGWSLTAENFQRPYGVPAGAYYIQFLNGTTPLTQTRMAVIQIDGEGTTSPSNPSAPSARQARISVQADVLRLVMQSPEWLQTRLEQQRERAASRTRRLEEADLRQAHYTKEIGEVLAAAAFSRREALTLGKEYVHLAERSVARAESQLDQHIKRQHLAAEKYMTGAEQLMTAANRMADQINELAKKVQTPAQPPSTTSALKDLLEGVGSLLGGVTPLILGAKGRKRLPERQDAPPGRPRPRAPTTDEAATGAEDGGTADGGQHIDWLAVTELIKDTASTIQVDAKRKADDADETE